MVGLIARRARQPRHQGDRCELCGRVVAVDERGRCPLGHQVLDPARLEDDPVVLGSATDRPRDPTPTVSTIDLDPAWSVRPDWVATPAPPDPAAADDRPPPRDVIDLTEPLPGPAGHATPTPQVPERATMPVLDPAPPPPVPGNPSLLDGETGSHITVDDVAFGSAPPSALDLGDLDGGEPGGRADDAEDATTAAEATGVADVEEAADRWRAEESPEELAAIRAEGRARILRGIAAALFVAALLAIAVWLALGL